MYLPYEQHNPFCAAKFLALLEMLLPCTDNRDQHPLFASGPDLSPFTYMELNTILQQCLVVLRIAQPEQYSWHSLRRYFACALKAAGADVSTIQRRADQRAAKHQRLWRGALRHEHDAEQHDQGGA